MNTNYEILILFIAVVLVFIVPLWLLVMEILSIIKHRNRTLMKNKDNIDNKKLESIKDKQTCDYFNIVDWGWVRGIFALLGVGIGILINYLLKKWILNNFLFWTTMAIGIGIGLFVAFILEIIIAKNTPKT